MTHRGRVRGRLGIALGVLGLAVACGARTELGAPPLRDAQTDVIDAMVEEDVRSEDVLPPIDQFNDSPIPTDCPDAGATLIYVISSENELFRFYPPTLAFTKIGDINCPSSASAYVPSSSHQKASSKRCRSCSAFAVKPSARPG